MAAPPETTRGLTRREALARLERFGPNALPPPERASFLRRLLRQLESALILLLLFALGMDVLVWFYDGRHGAPVEALAILAVLALNAGLGVIQEYRSESALDELEKLAAPLSWVERDGTLEQVSAVTLVPGDLVRLEAGDRVPADGIARRASALAVDESSLTGEALPIDKADSAELHSGTLVVRGRTELVVTATGPASTMGRLAASLSRIGSVKTPLELRIDALGRRLAGYVGALSVALVGAGLVVEGLARLPAVLMFAVAFAVAIVPESMPAMMTLSLALGVERMARRKAVVRRLAAVEALGSVTVIASDKTGTLTSNHLVVERLESRDEPEALLALVLANDADHARGAGDPLERALLEYATARGADVVALRSANPRVASEPFDSQKRSMSVIVERAGGELQRYLKGAAEIVIAACDLGAESRHEWEAFAEAEAERGFKVLGLATGRGANHAELRFLGCVSLWDAPRPDARVAVRAAEAAGIRVLMVTGDHPATARAIGERVGISSTRVLTGTELDALDEAALGAALEEIRVFSRLLPEHKLRIVEALQAKGEVVAMTGDGLNDAPALKKADVGVAMGQRGSEVAREVADVVLLDDRFSTIIAAVEEGRVIYRNIVNFVRYTSSSNVALTILVLGGAVGSMFLGLRARAGGVLLPLTALQILWINFLGDGPPALALAVDRGPNVMLERPLAPGTSLLDRPTTSFILVDGGFKGGVGLALLALLPALGTSLGATATAVFFYESLAKLLSAYPARRLGPKASSNAWLHLSIGAGVGLAVLCVALGPLRSTLALQALEPSAALPLVLAVVVTLASGEATARRLRARRSCSARG
ncbi:MAG TPA: cation-transporting P-type ATPase [Polyangiaceae bacterium]|nr:cation-transporting P-type ATPase [Polyangiaceae bacterium]